MEQTPTRGGTVLDRMLSWIVYPACLLTAIAYTTIRPVADPDTWFHMAFGRLTLANGALPAKDVFSASAQGSEWISSGWASSVLMHWLYQNVGYVGSGAGVIYMVFGVIAAAYLAIYFTGLVRYRAPAATVLLLLASILAAYLRFNPRPDVWSQLMMAIVALVLVTSDDVNDRPPRRIWLLPLLFALWPNLHAGFMAGLLLCAIAGGTHAIAWTGTHRRKEMVMLTAIGLCFIAWLANPYGYKIATLAQRIKDIPGFTENIFEWMPMIHRAGMNMPWPSYLGVGLLLVAAAWLLAGRPRNAPAWHIPAAIVFVAFAFYQRRQAGMMAVVLPAILLPYLPRLEWKLRARRLATAVVIVLFAIGICAMKSTGALAVGLKGPRVGRQCDFLPCLATDFLAQNRPPAVMCNTYGIGGYLLYHLGPETKVFIDGRLDLYPKEVWEDYLAVDEDRMPLDSFVAKYGINSYIAYIRDAKDDVKHIAHRLTRNPAWRLVYFDDHYATFVREAPENRSYLNEREFLYATPFAPERVEIALRDKTKAPEVRAEIERAMRMTEPMLSANALALAAVDMVISGDRKNADELVGRALAVDPMSFLAKRVAGREPAGD